MRSDEEMNAALVTSINWQELSAIVDELHGMLNDAQRRISSLHADRLSLSPQTYNERMRPLALRTTVVGDIARKLSDFILYGRNRDTFVVIEMTALVSAIGGSIAMMRLVKNTSPDNPDTVRTANELLETLFKIARAIEAAVGFTFVEG